MAHEDELKAFQEKQDAEARQQDEDAKAAQARMHQEIMQLLTTQMSAKKDNTVALVVGSTSIVQPDFVATVAPDVVPSVEVEPDVDLHMCEVSKSPPIRPLDLQHLFPDRLLAHHLGGFSQSHPQVPLLLRFSI